MSHSAPRWLRSASRALWLVLAVAVTLVLAPAAGAATVSMTGSDPVDASGNPKLDLTSGTVTYDSTAGKLTIKAQTVASNAGLVPADVFIIVGKSAGGKCEPNADVSPVVAFLLVARAESSLTKWFVTGTETPGEATVTRSGTTMSVTTGTDSRLKNLPLDCAQLQTKTVSGEDPLDVDFMNVFVGGGGGGPDKDEDGVADGSDKCPTVAGAGRDGCATISAKLAVRLGAKRVAIDKLVLRTGSACPVKAKVTVKSGKKTVGTGVISVTSHGKYCRAYGVVKLKKSVKKAKITVKGTGMGSIGATRKR